MALIWLTLKSTDTAMVSKYFHFGQFCHFPEIHEKLSPNIQPALEHMYNMALRCTFFWERKNLCSSKFVQLFLQVQDGQKTVLLKVFTT